MITILPFMDSLQLHHFIYLLLYLLWLKLIFFTLLLHFKQPFFKLKLHPNLLLVREWKRLVFLHMHFSGLVEACSVVEVWPFYWFHWRSYHPAGTFRSIRIFYLWSPSAIRTPNQAYTLDTDSCPYCNHCRHTYVCRCLCLLSIWIQWMVWNRYGTIDRSFTWAYACMGFIRNTFSMQRGSRFSPILVYWCQTLLTCHVRVCSFVSSLV